MAVTHGGGVLAECHCGALATHRASWIVTGGFAGMWEREDFCGVCVLAAADERHGSWRVEPLSSWSAFCRARDRWTVAQEAAANTDAQQRWAM